MSDNYKTRITDFFNQRTTYDSENQSHPENAQKLLNFVTVNPGQTILDLCTGTGLLAISAAKAVGQQGSVIGGDLSPGMLAQAKTKIKSEEITNLELIEADVELINFHNEQFDLIFCCSALVYVRDITALLNKCYLWLKPGGCLAFTASNKGSHLSEAKVRVCKNLFDIDLPHIIRPLWTREKCLKLLQNSGFHNSQLPIASLAGKGGLVKPS